MKKCIVLGVLGTIVAIATPLYEGHAPLQYGKIIETDIPDWKLFQTYLYYNGSLVKATPEQQETFLTYDTSQLSAGAADRRSKELSDLIYQADQSVQVAAEQQAVVDSILYDILPSLMG